MALSTITLIIMALRIINSHNVNQPKYNMYTYIKHERLIINTRHNNTQHNDTIMRLRIMAFGMTSLNINVLQSVSIRNYVKF
jgi:hypothetical protein